MRALWCSQRFLHFKLMGKNFVAQGQVTPKLIVWTGPKSKLFRNFVTVFVICKFDKDPMKNEGPVLTRFSPLQVYRENFCHSVASNSKVNSPIWPKIELIRDFMPVLVSCKFDEDQIKTEGISMETSFSAKFSFLKCQ